MLDYAGIDNSALLPVILPDCEVKVDENGTPDWLKNLILVQVRISTATEEGTLESAEKLLRHYSQMGVNGIWLCPVFEPDIGGNGYCNLGPHTIDPAITGTKDYSEGFSVLKRFIAKAHALNIRIILDIITWGTGKNSPLLKEHPEWYMDKELWGGIGFEWKNKEFCEWYKEQIVALVENTGCDGLRLDCEPSYASKSGIFTDLRKIFLNKGIKQLVISEARRDSVKKTYDCEQAMLSDPWPSELYTQETASNYFINRYNIVDFIHSGKLLTDSGQSKYYMNMVVCHDTRYTVVRRNPLAIGYQAIFSPFLTAFWIGEEWNNPKQISGGCCLYFNKIDWNELEKPENKSFFEYVKDMIRVYRKYSEIFSNFSKHFTDVNVCKVDATGVLQAYARYAGDKAALIIPNLRNDGVEDISVVIPFEDMQMNREDIYRVFDAFTEVIIAEKAGTELNKLHVLVKPGDQRVLILEKINL